MFTYIPLFPQNTNITIQLKRFISQTLTAPYRFASGIFAWAGGDMVKILTDPKSLITNELYERSIQNGGVGIGFLSMRPVMYVFSGDKGALMKVAQYGEREQVDVHARDDFAIIEAALGYKTVVNLTGQPAVTERQRLKKHITGDDRLNDLIKLTSEFLGKYLENSWDEAISLQDHLGYLSMNIIARNFLGIPHVSMEHLPLIRRLSALIDAGNKNSREFQQLVAQLRAIDLQSLRDNKNDIINSEKYISDHLQIDEGDTDEIITQKLSAIPSVSTLILQDNLTATIIMAVAQIAKSDNIRSRLREELERDFDSTEPNHRNLRKLKYLDAIYKETLRYVSPTAILARKTSKRITFQVNNTDVVIAPQSRLFVPIRRIHHDERYWDQPEVFNPDRFLENKRHEYFMPFSIGQRACPAGGTGYAEMLVKMFIVGIFSRHDLVIDQPLEVIPKESTYPRWEHPCFAKLRVNDGLFIEPISPM